MRQRASSLDRWMHRSFLRRFGVLFGVLVVMLFFAALAEVLGGSSWGPALVMVAKLGVPVAVVVAAVVAYVLGRKLDRAARANPAYFDEPDA